VPDTLRDQRLAASMIGTRAASVLRSRFSCDQRLAASMIGTLPGCTFRNEAFRS